MARQLVQKIRRVTVTKVVEIVNRCAVVGCDKEGKPQVCPYDGGRHHHGRIHYDCGYPKHSLEFHADQWDLICDEHYLVCVQERRELERQNRAAS